MSQSSEGFHFPVRLCALLSTYYAPGCVLCMQSWEAVAHGGTLGLGCDSTTGWSCRGRAGSASLEENLEELHGGGGIWDSL